MSEDQGSARDHDQTAGVSAQEQTFTPGPWCVEAPFGGGATDEGDLSIVQAGLQTYEWQFIAHLPYGPPSEGAVPLAQVKANARLIAAAPELLEALRATVTAWRAAKAGDIAAADWMNAAQAQAEAAIVQATGQ